MSTQPVLPTPIDRLVAAVNRGDTPAFLALFADDGIVDDWGCRFEGHDAIRAWSDRQFIGVSGQMKVRRAARHGRVVTLEADWHSTLYRGASRFIFALDGERVLEMCIPARWAAEL